MSLAKDTQVQPTHIEDLEKTYSLQSGSTGYSSFFFLSALLFHSGLTIVHQPELLLLASTLKSRISLPNMGASP